MVSVGKARAEQKRLDSEAKLQHRRAFQAEMPPQAAPVLEFQFCFGPARSGDWVIFPLFAKS